MPINKNELTKELIEKAMQCKTADELMVLAKSEGFAIMLAAGRTTTQRAAKNDQFWAN